MSVYDSLLKHEHVRQWKVVPGHEDYELSDDGLLRRRTWGGSRPPGFLLMPPLRKSQENVVWTVSYNGVTKAVNLRRTWPTLWPDNPLPPVSPVWISGVKKYLAEQNAMLKDEKREQITRRSSQMQKESKDKKGRVVEVTFPYDEKEYAWL